MKIQNGIIIVLCLFLTACLANLRSFEGESKAKDAMDRAKAFEDAKAYPQAAQEYAMVAERFPSASYHKQAVWKTALLNMHPDNPENNYDAALSWLRVYLKLPLSSGEKEAATSYVAMIERINGLQSELSSTVKEKDRLFEITQKQSRDIESDTKRRKELEAELDHAWDELNKMKAVDVRMHRSRVEKNVGQPAQTVQKISKPKSDKEKTTPQSEQYAQVKDKISYPYLIQVSSYKNKEDSMREAMILRDKGDSVCISYAHIAGKGDWYRVLVGFYRTPEEAQKAAVELKKREYENAFVVRRPFTVELGVFSDIEKLKKIEKSLISQGFSAYSLPDRETKNKTRLLLGAFWTEEEAARVIEDLRKKGFRQPKAVRR